MQEVDVDDDDDDDDSMDNETTEGDDQVLYSVFTLPYLRGSSRTFINNI